ncbi:hypothetical protein C2G38_2100415 [Gigaspora rosea]|uniref:Uncharacterized protein n=1 Tax=Gigaspora rosea TaxID=44941 RepID=A0A397UZM1_9GLOM|nr:hypothetical protein C2G38_2100415 [Gigaspora rosea]CAG8636908.1 19038_t:CDS:1 [Gigaspora rosea]
MLPRITNLVFLHTNPCFEYLKINTQLKDLTIFVVGQMEIINNKFYVNTKDINYFDIKKNSDTVSLQIQPTSTNPTRSRLLQIHQNITKNLKEAPVIQTSSLTTSSDIESESSVKRKRSEEIDQLIDVDFINTNDNYKSETIKANSVKTNQEKLENPIKKPKLLKNSTRPPIKECPIRTTRSSKKSCHTTIEDAESDKE